MGHVLSDSIITLLNEWKIKTVIVKKKSELLDEWYQSGEDEAGPLYSCTKSVLSALIGIAIDRGELTSLDQKMAHILNCRSIVGDVGENITIKDLLTMTPGFDWPDFDKPYKELRASQDPITFALQQPIIHEPGQSFTYNSGGSHLLSAILTKVTGMSALEYGKRHLFEPMQFQFARWSERNGISEGGTGLSLYGQDLAKIGSLYIQDGVWEGKQLLSRDWTRESTRLHHRGLLNYEPPIYGGYGYHWWCSPAEHNDYADCYFAFGHGGQYLLMIPSLEIVIVIRKQITKRNDAIYARKLIFEHLVPSIVAQ
ncbi:serine hydrolase [Paenibacillus sp. L3-i20]|uniref:serine hydrolase domain-containing protein n=1 Tax=Paenibacillus sp. L3-i20 TaxID=2905833 RepID=UPI001EE11A5C|nr:serine hydrolase [Paenibacillus sp. L3-i20]GKU78798.1 serine hydrolase [Paenibacillus sp. L3-i20]